MRHLHKIIISTPDGERWRVKVYLGRALVTSMTSTDSKELKKVLMKNRCIAKVDWLQILYGNMVVTMEWT